MKSLEGKVAIITGAGRGQGRSHALTLARAGAKIVAGDIDVQIDSMPYPMNAPTDLDETVRLVQEVGGKCVGIQADVRDADQVDALVAHAGEQFGGIDILVANAGGWAFSPVVGMTDAQWHDVIAVNLTGAFHCIRAVAEPMIQRGGGRIVVTCSTAGRQGVRGMSNYAASRWGQLGMVKSVAAELGPFGITVNALCVSMTESLQFSNEAGWKAICPNVERPTREDAENALRTQHSLPTAWLPTQDVSNAVRFLVSDDARYITGTGIDLTAGKASAYAA